MIKVRLLTGVTAATAAVLSFPALTGCAGDATAEDGSSSADNTESFAGSGALTLHGYSLTHGSTSGGDDLVRAGERLKVSCSLEDVLQLLHVGNAGDKEAIDAARKDPASLKAAARVRYTKTDGSTYDAPAMPLAFAPGAGGVMVGQSQEVVVPKGVRRMKLEISAEVKLAGVPVTRDLLASHAIPAELPIFGAYLPNKMALFDTEGGGRRSRIVEGGAVKAGARLTLAVTDWRLDTVVDKSRLDTRIGQKQNYGRFGATLGDAFGALEYEVSAAVSTDGGKTYQPLGLHKVDRPDVLNNASRFTFEEGVDVAAGAGPAVKVAFHVRAVLAVPSYAPGEIQNPRYAPGQRVVLADVWDNNGGQDYTLPIGP